MGTVKLFDDVTDAQDEAMRAVLRGTEAEIAGIAAEYAAAIVERDARIRAVFDRDWERIEAIRREAGVEPE